MKRIDALQAIDDAFCDHPLIATCGATARELASIGSRDTHLPLLDSMGLTCAVGLGVALGSEQPVGVIDGDGSLLMGFSILPTLAGIAPGNLTVIVLDNGQHASADGMPSQAAVFDLVAAIAGCGIETAVVDDTRGLAAAVEGAIADGIFSVIVGRIEPGNMAGIPFLLEDPAVLADRFGQRLSRR
jgi:thiamine pyrophosphate-dependent acetolactate synthase large subunit-like protein